MIQESQPIFNTLQMCCIEVNQTSAHNKLITKYRQKDTTFQSKEFSENFNLSPLPVLIIRIFKKYIIRKLQKIQGRKMEKNKHLYNFLTFFFLHCFINNLVIQCYIYSNHRFTILKQTKACVQKRAKGMRGHKDKVTV